MRVAERTRVRRGRPRADGPDPSGTERRRAERGQRPEGSRGSRGLGRLVIISVRNRTDHLLQMVGFSFQRRNMETREIDQYLHTVVLAAYESRPVYLRVFDDRVHPEQLPPEEIPKRLDVLMHFRIEGLRIKDDRYHAVNTFFAVLQRTAQAFDVFVDVRAYRLGAFDVACIVIGTRDGRLQFVQGLMARLREESDLTGVDQFRVGVASPFEAAYLTQWMLQKVHIVREGQHLFPHTPDDCRNVRGQIVRMMHELALRRIDVGSHQGNLLRFARRVSQEKWMDWQQADAAEERHMLPANVEALFPRIDTFRYLMVGTAREKLRKLAELNDLIVGARLDELLAHRLSAEEVYEYYATAYLLHQSHDIGTLARDPSIHGTVQPFDVRHIEKEPNVDLLEKPAAIEKKDYGPEHYGYSVVETEKWDTRSDSGGNPGKK